MGLYAKIPNDVEALKKQISALEWLLEHDTSEKDREIHEATLAKMKSHLDVIEQHIFITDPASELQ